MHPPTDTDVVDLTGDDSDDPVMGMTLSRFVRKATGVIDLTGEDEPQAQRPLPSFQSLFAHSFNSQTVSDSRLLPQTPRRKQPVPDLRSPLHDLEAAINAQAGQTTPVG